MILLLSYCLQGNADMCECEMTSSYVSLKLDSISWGSVVAACCAQFSSIAEQASLSEWSVFLVGLPKHQVPKTPGMSL